MDTEYDTIDCLVEFNDAWQNTKKRISSFFTINIDPFRISNDPIKFKGHNEYGGYKIIGSLDEFHRRIVHWFYRNNDTPTLNDWLDCTYIFNLREIPIHILQLYDENKDPLSKFILIHAITSQHIHYTFENREDNESTTVTVPIGVASLVPERFLFNLKLYSRPRKP